MYKDASHSCKDARNLFRQSGLDGSSTVPAAVLSHQCIFFCLIRTCCVCLQQVLQGREARMYLSSLFDAQTSNREQHAKPYITNLVLSIFDCVSISQDKSLPGD